MIPCHCCMVSYCLVAMLPGHSWSFFINYDQIWSTNDNSSIPNRIALGSIIDPHINSIHV